jgi:AcrR family transcriptional regulator
MATVSSMSSAPGTSTNGVNREAKRVATSQAIELAALRLFGASGFEAPTAAQIASAAGVSVRTFFRHFPGGKEDVMLLESRRTMSLLREALQARPPHESALTAVREAVRSLPWYAEGYGEDQAIHMFGQIANGHPDLLARMLGERQLLAEPLVELVALRMSTDPTRDLRPRLLLHGVHAAMTATWLTWISEPGLDLSSMLESALDVLENGMASAMGSAPRAVPGHPGSGVRSSAEGPVSGD